MRALPWTLALILAAGPYRLFSEPSRAPLMPLGGPACLSRGEKPYGRRGGYAARSRKRAHCSGASCPKTMGCSSFSPRSSQCNSG